MSPNKGSSFNLFAINTCPIMRKENYSRIKLRLGIGESFGIVEAVSSNGRIRGKTQRRRFESYAIPFIFFRIEYMAYYGNKTREDDDMTKQEIIETIQVIDEQLEKNKKYGAYIPITPLLMDNRKIFVDLLYCLYGIVYV